MNIHYKTENGTSACGSTEGRASGDVSITTCPACGDYVRKITGCPQPVEPASPIRERFCVKAFVLAAGLALSLNASAAIKPTDAVNALVGEAGNQPYAAQLAIAGSLRLRGSLQGVYGVHNRCVSKASSRTIHTAHRAWNESASHNTAQGCRYFGCQSDTGYFASIGLHKQFTIGQISFWK